MPQEPLPRVVTGECRFSFVHLWEPFTSIPKADPKYSVMLLIPKSDKATMKRLRDAEEKAKEIGKSTKWGGKLPRNLESIIHDGDEEGDVEAYPEQAGHYYMTVSSNAQYKPGIIDRSKQEILDPTEVYSGCYGRVSLTAFPYSVPGKNGVSFGLNNVQKMRDGESLVGVRKAEADFDDLDDEDGVDESLI